MPTCHPISRSIVLVSGSPSATSKTAMVGDFVCDWMEKRSVRTSHLKVRELSPQALLTGDISHQPLSAALDLIAEADGLVIATPTFKASFSGLLKAFLDLLPQYGLKDKVIMLLGTGGSMAHVLALDYSLRPVMQSMRPRQIVPSVFLLEKDLGVRDNGISIELQSRALLIEILEEFNLALGNLPSVQVASEEEFSGGNQMRF